MQGGGATPSTVLFNGNRNGNVGIGITPTASSKLNIGGLNSSYFVDLTCSGPGGSRAIRFLDGGTPTKYNWLVGAQHNVDNAFEITASTAVGGTTFNSPLFLVNQSGAIGIGGTNYGTSGQVLTSNGSNSAPAWQTPSAGGDFKTKGVTLAMVRR